MAEFERSLVCDRTRAALAAARARAAASAAHPSPLTSFARVSSARRARASARSPPRSGSGSAPSAARSRRQSWALCQKPNFVPRSRRRPDSSGTASPSNEPRLNNRSFLARVSVWYGNPNASASRRGDAPPVPRDWSGRRAHGHRRGASVPRAGQPQSELEQHFPGAVACHQVGGAHLQHLGDLGDRDEARYTRPRSSSLT